MQDQTRLISPHLKVGVLRHVLIMFQSTPASGWHAPQTQKRKNRYFNPHPLPDDIIFARYLPSFCFAILLPLSSFCFIIGARDSSFLAPFPLFRTVAAVRNFYLLILYTTSYTKSRIKAPLTEQKNQKNDWQVLMMVLIYVYKYCRWYLRFKEV